MITFSKFTKIFHCNDCFKEMWLIISLYRRVLYAKRLTYYIKKTNFTIFKIKSDWTRVTVLTNIEPKYRKNTPAHLL